MAFIGDLDKPLETPNELEVELLTCSASDYAKSQGRDLTAYELVGVSTEDKSMEDLYFRRNTPRTFFQELAKKKGCIAVVDLKNIWDPNYTSLRYSGTGLILKKMEETEKDKQGEGQ